MKDELEKQTSPETTDELRQSGACGVRQTRWQCEKCGKDLPDDYEPQYCCSGMWCGCRGLPTNPPICDFCWFNRALPQRMWEDCPNCPNQGFTVRIGGGVHYITQDMAVDAGMPEIEGQRVDETYEEQEQCEFCYTNPKSVFYQENKLYEAKNA